MRGNAVQDALACGGGEKHARPLTNSNNSYQHTLSDTDYTHKLGAAVDTHTHTRARTLHDRYFKISKC